MFKTGKIEGGSDVAFPLIADASFSSVYQITAELLLRKKIHGLLVDLDNTLAPYLQEDPDAGIIDWVHGLQAAGIRVLVLSNNHEPRVSRFCAPLDCQWLSEAGKPGKEAYRRGVEQLSLSEKEIAVVGDQIFTDTIGARRAGLCMLLVRPVRLRGYPLYQLRRVAEWPFVALTPRATTWRRKNK